MLGSDPNPPKWTICLAGSPWSSQVTISNRFQKSFCGDCQIRTDGTLLKFGVFPGLWFKPLTQISSLFIKKNPNSFEGTWISLYDIFYYSLFYKKSYPSVSLSKMTLPEHIPRRLPPKKLLDDANEIICRFKLFIEFFIAL